MTPYKVQYWLYAIINANFGKDVKIVRDPLHRRYDVNRHGMILTSSKIPADVLGKFMCKVLRDHGYTLLDDGGAYTKRFDKKTCVINIHQRQCFEDGRQRVYVHPMVY